MSSELIWNSFNNQFDYCDACIHSPTTNFEYLFTFLPTKKIVGVTHNHKLGYFETYDGSSIREVLASETDAVHSVDVSCDGNPILISEIDCAKELIRWLLSGLYIVTAGADRQVKVSFLNTKV